MFESTSDTSQPSNLLPATWRLPISRWSIWQDNPLENTSPNVDFIDANARRKLSKFAKMGLKVANDCSVGIRQARFVFASQHGDLKRATDMLFNLALKEELSPIVFSMSVLNATAGMYSIAKQDHSPSIAVSAGISSFGYGILEAALQHASNPAIPVIFVYVDEAPPAICEVQQSAPYHSHAVGVLISGGASIELSCTLSSTENASSSVSQSEAFVHALVNKKNNVWSSDGQRWDWVYSER